MFTLYKVFYEEGLVYIGRTIQPLSRRLKDHYCRKHRLKELSQERITRVEYATCESLSDLYVYEVFYINRLKPILNKDDKAHDSLNLELPPLQWILFEQKDIRSGQNAIIKKNTKAAQ